MFNDEIFEIRLQAIHILHKIASKHVIRLSQDQLQNVLSSLQDASSISRFAAHKMLRFG